MRSFDNIIERIKGERVAVIFVAVFLVIILTAFFVFFFGPLLFLMYSNEAQEVSDEVMMQSRWDSYYENVPNKIEDHPMFSSVEEATKYYYEDRYNGAYSVSKRYEIFRISKGDYTLVLYAKHENSITSFLYLRQDNSISYPIQEWSNWLPIPAKPFGDNYRTKHHTEEDWVASHLIQTILAPYYSDLTGFENFYYGFGTEKSTYDLTILGYAPTEVIPYKYKWKTYYFWYYDYSVPFAEVLLEHLDTTEFTLADVIDCMDISFDKES